MSFPHSKNGSGMFHRSLATAGSRGQGHRFYVQGFLILVQPSGDPNYLSNESFHFPCIRQAILGSVEELLHEKTILLLRDFSSERADILLRLLLRAILSLVAVLALLRILLLRLASGFLAADAINWPHENGAKQSDSCDPTNSGAHRLNSGGAVAGSAVVARAFFEAVIPIFVLRW